MRIVAGSARGRTLLTPRTAGIRPTADRVRESLFNILGQWLEGQTVLDLFAGTGALSMEALSRGAVRAVLVDQDREALKLCRQNADALGFRGQVEIQGMPVQRAVELLGRRGEPFDLVFADPPYALHLAPDILRWVDENKLLKPDGTLVVEHERKEIAPESHGGLTRTDQRRFGDTLVSLYRFA